MAFVSVSKRQMASIVELSCFTGAELGGLPGDSVGESLCKTLGDAFGALLGYAFDDPFGAMLVIGCELCSLAG